ncbi:MAG: DUF5691 domain-containing protein, partial [Janthinobacterium lividum]
MSWDDLVTSALLGTDRRPPALVGLPAEVRALLPGGDEVEGVAADEAARLLTAAALATAYRRAGALRTVPLTPPPAPAAPETRPVLGSAAAASLLSLLAGREFELAVELLRLAAGRGLVLAPAVLPAVLDAGSGDRTLADAASPVLGTRGRWLARARTSWIPQAARATGDDDCFEHGSLAERVDFVRGLRRRDPAAARDLVARDWSQFSADEREQFIATFADHLDTADEELLDRALAERRYSTRDTAVHLLARLPDSGYSRRALQRARDCVQVIVDPLRGSRFEVTPPLDCDERMVHDGIAVLGAHENPRTEGVRAHWLRQVVAATPLRYWGGLVTGTAQDVLAVKVTGGWGPTLLEGWAVAAARQRDPAWARALLPHRLVTGRAELLDVLEAGQQADVVSALLRDVPANSVGAAH